MAGFSHIFQQIEAAEDAVPFGDVAAEGKTAAFLAAHQPIHGGKTGADMLEAYRHFVDGDAVFFPQLVQHHRGGNALDQGAALAFVFQQIEGQQGKDFQGADKVALFVDQSHPVGIAVEG